MTTHLKNSTGVDLQRCHVYMAYGALLLLSPLSSLAQNSLASHDAPYLKPVTVTASASGGVSPLDDSPAGIGHVTVLSNIEINQGTTDRLEDLLQQAGLAAADVGSSFGLANVLAFGDLPLTASKEPI